MVIYSTKGGTTQKVAFHVAKRLKDDHVLDVGSVPAVIRQRPDMLLLFCPTYGDSEVEDSFERFLVTWNWSGLRGVGFAFCELGIYTGYEDFGHGLAPAVSGVLQRHGLCQLAPTLSLDSVPVTDWRLVDRWIAAIQGGVALAK